MRPSHPRMSVARALGLTFMGTVGSLLALDFLVFQGQARQVLQAGSLLWSPGFVFFGTQLLVVSVALFAFALSRRGGGEEEEVDLTLDRLEALLEKSREVNGVSSGGLPLDIESLRRLQTPKLSKIHVVAVIEGVVVLLLFGWLVVEFGSNIFMRDWVLGRVPWAGYVLNFVSVALVAGAFVGIVASQLIAVLRTRRRARLKP